MKNFALFLVLFVSSLLIGCKEPQNNYVEEILLDQRECIADKEGGDFTLHVLKYKGDLQIFWWVGEDTETTKYLYQSATCDTLITNWYKAVLIKEESPIINITVLPNDSLIDRSDNIALFGDNCHTSIDIKQAAF